MKPSKFLSGFLVAALILSGCKQENAPQLSAASPPQVVVAAVQQRDVPIVREWIGQLDGSENVDVRARVSGYLQEIAFKEGTVVKPGDLLLRIDPRPFEAAVAQEEADLAQATATQEKTQLEAEEDILVKAYCFDDRLNWNTYIVTVRNYGVVGFTDGPVPE